MDKCTFIANMAPTPTSTIIASKVSFSPEEIREKVLEPFTYICGLPGKGIRDNFARCFNKWFENREEDLKLAVEYIDKFHNASLVLDDIEDGSDLRRGSPSAHIKYGIPMAINAGCCASYVIQRELMAWERCTLELVAKSIDGIIQCHEGQGMEIYWRDNLTSKNILTDCPTLQDYEDIICSKTGTFFRICLELAQHMSPKPELKKHNLENFGKNFGIYFQMRDDLMNICNDKYAESKGFAEDITEGKLSCLIIHCLNNPDVPNEKKLRLFEILGMRTTDLELKKEALEVLKRAGSMDNVRKRLSEVHTKIFEEIEEMGFGDNEILENFFNENLWLGN